MVTDAFPVDIAGVTDVGGRDDNQDRFLVLDATTAVLSDGMGGHAGGARAAELTVEAAGERLGTGDSIDGETLTSAFTGANERVRKEREERVEEQRMGATLTIAVPDGGSPDEWLVGHVGDSPAFKVTGTTIIRLTDDHTIAWELVRQGAISEAAAEVHPQRNVLLRAIGAEDEVQPDIQSVRLEPGESLVLMSDGVSGVVGMSVIRDLVTAAESAEDAATALVRTAIELETTDNATAIVVRRLPDDA